MGASAPEPGATPGTADSDEDDEAEAADAAGEDAAASASNGESAPPQIIGSRVAMIWNSSPCGTSRGRAAGSRYPAPCPRHERSRGGAASSFDPLPATTSRRDGEGHCVPRLPRIQDSQRRPIEREDDDNQRRACVEGRAEKPCLYKRDT